MSRRIEYRREFPVVELRAVAPDEGAAERSIEGYAAVFEQETVIGGVFREVLRRGAFKKTLQEGDQVALWNHNDAMPLGRRSRGTMDLSEDDKGLKFRISLGDTSWGRDAYEAVKRGDVEGMSFGFSVIKESWEEAQSETRDGLALRELLEVRLFEVSPVTFPAYAGTAVEEAEARAIVEGAGIVTTQEPLPVQHSEPELEAGNEDGSERAEMIAEIMALEP